MNSIRCTPNDMFSYNYQGPRKSSAFGDRSFFKIHISRPGMYSVTSTCKSKLMIIVAPTGRVVLKKSIKKDTPRKFKASITGVYLLKFWNDVWDYYTLVITGEDPVIIEQMIHSPGQASMDGCLFDRHENQIVRKNGIFKCDPQTRTDRIKKSTR